MAGIGEFDLGAALAKWFDAEGRAMVTTVTREAAEASFKHSTGAFASRFFVTRHTSAFGSMHIDVRNDSLKPAVAWVTEGTRPHEIHPRGDYPLSFFWERAGGRVSSWGWHGAHYGFVRHPGTRPNPFIEAAMARLSGLIPDSITPYIRIALGGS